MDRFGKTHPPCYCSCLAAELFHSTLPPAGAISLGSRQGCGDEREAVILVLRLLAWSQSGPESQLASVLRVAGSSPSLSHPRALNLEHTQTHTHTHACTHTLTYTLTHIHTHTYIHIYSQTHTCTYSHKTHLHTFSPTATHSHIFTHTHTYACTCTHVCTYGHTLSSESLGLETQPVLIPLTLASGPFVLNTVAHSRVEVTHEASA